MSKTLILLMGLCILAISLPVETHAQPKTKKSEKTSVEKKDSTSTDTTKKVSLADKVKTCKKTEGLFTLYQDTVNGSIKIYIGKNQLDKEYLYQSFSMGGPAELFLNQNMIRETWLFKIRKNFDRINWYRSNTSYYFDKSNAVSKAANVDVAETNFYSEKLIAEDSLGYLIEGDNLFISEKLDPVKPFLPPGLPPGAVLNLGTLSKDKSQYSKIRSFPNNTDVVVDLSYENSNPMNFGGPDITDPRYINVKMQHSFIELPENDYRPRFDNPQLGYFTVQSENMTTTETPIYHDFITRWHLKKKNPNQAVSEVVEPIVWWVENTTPVELRQIIIDAGHKWNEAFEAAGFKNAVVMKMMPDDADWDPADIRYNVIRWVSSDLGFAIGPSFVNPRTGQILGADITIDYAFMRGIASETDLFEKAHQQDFGRMFQPHQCKLGNGKRHQHSFAEACLEAFDASEADKKELLTQFMTELVLHEMGHTLGLMHNMKSSHMLNPDQLRDKSITQKYGVIGSVMDYSAVNLSLDPANRGDFYTTKVGPYDIWAIQYGYMQFSEKEESAGLAKIVSKSTDPMLIFGNDADIAFPGGGIDPRAMVWDMSSDMPAYAAERMQLVNQTMGKLKSKFVTNDRSYENLTSKFYALQRQRFGMAFSLAAYIGGIYVDRSLPGQNSGKMPYTPIDIKIQKKAMNVLNTYVFAPDAYTNDAALYNYLQRQRRGFNFFGRPEDPKIDAVALGLQSSVLYSVFNPATLRRINNSKLYGNQYGITDVFADLEKGIFDADLKGEVNSFRMGAQQQYVSHLISIINAKSNNYGTETKAAAFYRLTELAKILKKANSGDEATKAHRSYLRYQIKEALDKD